MNHTIIELAFQDDLLNVSNSNGNNKSLPKIPILLPQYVTPQLPTWKNVGTNPMYAALPVVSCWVHPKSAKYSLHVKVVSMCHHLCQTLELWYKAGRTHKQM